MVRLGVYVREYGIAVVFVVHGVYVKEDGKLRLKPGTDDQWITKVEWAEWQFEEATRRYTALHVIISCSQIIFLASL